ncbi:MAG: DegV family protein [Acutalibacteraceae bacterium]|nr:DegV family protein [Acutalibacteraceae bacterium]
MKNIIITTDSTSDLSPELIQKYGIKVLPLNIVSETDSKKDGIEINAKDVFEYQRKTGKLLKTAAANVAEWEDFFDNLPENDGVVNFTISSEMSSTFTNSKLAADERNEIYTIDSRNLSTGIGLLILTACDLREQGLSAKEIYEKIEALKPYVRASFVIDTLEFLHKGGRCSAIAALGANLLKLKPCIEVKDGKMGVAKKYRGKITEVIPKYIKDKLADFDKINPDKVFITHTMDDENIYIVDEMLKYIKDNYNFKNVYTSTAGCTVSVHCGPNTLGILYIDKE